MTYLTFVHSKGITVFINKKKPAYEQNIKV